MSMTIFEEPWIHLKECELVQPAGQSFRARLLLEYRGDGVVKGNYIKWSIQEIDLPHPNCMKHR